MSYNLIIKKAYNFSLRATAILGISYDNAVVMAIMDYDSARLIQDVSAIHTQVYSALPKGTPRNANDLVYVKIRTTTGEFRVLAMDWIAAEPVLVTSNTVRFTIRDISITDVSRVNDILIQHGYTKITSELI